MSIKRPKAKVKKITAKIAKKVRQDWCQMVIRVRVPVKMVKSLKIEHVRAIDYKGGLLHELEILNAYYDIAGNPDAMPHS